MGAPRPDPQLHAVTEAFQRLPAAQRGVAEAVLRQPGLLDLAGQLLAPAGVRRGRDARARPARRALEQEWRTLIGELDDAQVLRLLAVARAMAAQESAAQVEAETAPLEPSRLARRERPAKRRGGRP